MLSDRLPRLLPIATLIGYLATTSASYTDGLPAPGGIRALERDVISRLRADQPRTEPLTEPITLRALDLNWSLPGEEPFLSADSLLATIAPASILAGEIDIKTLSLFDPDLVLEEGPPPGGWNIERAWTRLLSRDEGPTGPDAEGGGVSVLIQNAQISAGDLVVHPLSGEVIALHQIEARVSEILFPGEVGGSPHIALEHLTTALEIPDEELEVALAISMATLDIEPERIPFTIAQIIADSSIFTETTGVYHLGVPGLALDLRSTGDRLLLRDLRAFLPRAPETGTATFELSLTTDPAGRSTLALTSLDIVAEGSQLLGSITLAFGGQLPPGLLGVDLQLEPLTIALIEGVTGPLPYTGEIRGWIRGPPRAVRFDLSASLTAPEVTTPFTAGLTGEARFSGVGFQLAELDIGLHNVPLLALRPFIPALSMKGVISGHLLMRGMPGEAPTQIDLRLEVAAGVINLAGVIDLSGDRPSYNLTGETIDLHLQELLALPLPPVALTSEFRLEGEGTTLDAANTRLDLTGQFTGWETGPADSINLHVALDNARVTVETATIEIGPIFGEVDGSWHFEAPASGALNYTLNTGSDTQLDGISADSLVASGTISGELPNARIEGTLAATTIIYDEWRADSLAVTHDLTLDSPLTSAVVNLRALRLETPVGTLSDLLVDGNLADDLLSIERLAFTIDHERWSLIYPARVVWTERGEGFDIENLLLRQEEGPGELAIDGRYPPGEERGLTLTMTSIPIADLLMAAGYGPILTGLLDLDLRLRGPPDQPTSGGTFRLTDASYRGLPIEIFEGALLAEAERLDLEITATLDSIGIIVANGTLPISLRLEGIPQLSVPRDEPVHLRATADSLPMRVLTLTLPELRAVEGRINAVVELDGTLDSPTLAGDAEVIDGAMTIIPIDQRYDQISGSIHLVNQEVIVESLRAHSGGWATLEGRISLVEISDPALDLNLILDEFQAIGVDNLRAAEMTGELIIGGSIQEPVLAGAITVDDGNLALPQLGSGPEIEPLDLPAAELDLIEPLGDGEPPPGGRPSPFDQLTLSDLIITAGDDLWFVTDQFRAQLAGLLTLSKDPGEGLEISGTLEGSRGVFTLQVGPLVRRFTLVETNVRFLGTPEIDPLLDITASRIIPGAGGQFTEVLLHLSGTLSHPEVEISTADGASVPESELLSFLLFGRPSFASPGQFPVGGPILEEAVFGIGSLAEIASIGIEEALISDLGLPIDYFLIQPTQGPLGGLGAPMIVIGQEIAPDLYLTINTGFGGLFGAGASPATAWTLSLQWRITSEWTLELALQPVNPARFFRGLGTALPIVGFERQLIVELRRRWTY